MTVQIQLRRDMAANWTSANPILAQGEPGLELDTHQIKYGDGSSHWTALAYAVGSGSGGGGTAGPQGPQGPQGVAGPRGSDGQSFTYRGIWSGSTAYVLDDVVTGSDGSSYIALNNTTGNDPTTDSTHVHWQAIAIHGATGPQGSQGPQGVQGAAGSTGPTGPAAPTTISATQQAGAYTLALTDAAAVVEGTSATAQTFTVPPNSSVAFPVGTVVEVFQYGAGQITIAAGAGVTLRSDGGKAKTAAQYATVGLRQRAANEWVLSGDLST